MVELSSIQHTVDMGLYTILTRAMNMLLVDVVIMGELLDDSSMYKRCKPMPKCYGDV